MNIVFADSYFESLFRLASQSRDRDSPFRSNSDFPLIVSPLILPLYLVTNLFPLFSRVTVKEMVSPLIFASSISVSVLFRPEILPVSLSPSCFSFRVVSRLCPFWPEKLQVHV